ncbi:hypothetical protein ASE52_11555 [Acidovorax sp. Root275]|uniref:DUF4166 domain-containing protein n=1 Tax=Acidovorax sp. Root275 TaxID=1736508 RepID=UPI0007111350|nr:DUF4166 domain-containing protein [Acidovorax sp. Root275]KRD48033.1 hypothetical protein ASE52_11555 [Acidovorax sp. Root275]
MQHPLSLYQRAMGPAYLRLAPALARFHALSGPQRLSGHVLVDAPANWLARVLALALGAPQRAAQGPISFELDARPDAEVWTRHFPAQTMQSTLRGAAGRVVEHLGAARLTFVLHETEGRLVMQLQQLHFCGIPCPAWLCPQLVAEETGVGDALHFHVQATVPGVGRVVRYQGHLMVPPDAVPAGASA